MKRSFFAKCIALLLMLTLFVGQGAFMPAMAVDARHETAMQDMSGMDMSDMQMGHKDCCPSPEKNQDNKGNMCASACAAMTQAALPSFHPVFIRQVAVLAYEPAADTTAVGQFVSPDHPPPRT